MCVCKTSYKRGSSYGYGATEKPCPKGGMCANAFANAVPHPHPKQSVCARQPRPPWPKTKGPRARQIEIEFCQNGRKIAEDPLIFFLCVFVGSCQPQKVEAAAAILVTACGWGKIVEIEGPFLCVLACVCVCWLFR